MTQLHHWSTRKPCCHKELHDCDSVFCLCSMTLVVTYNTFTA